VADGFALLQALEAHPDAAVLIAIHSGSSTGTQAHSMLLGRHPSAANCSQRPTPAEPVAFCSGSHRRAPGLPSTG
jgi:hypothetical protein